MITLRIVIRTLMVVTIIGCSFFTYKQYSNFNEAKAQAIVPMKPNFEHSNNQQFLNNVKQCVDYIYFYNDVEEVNLELLLAQAALESGWGNSRFAQVGKNLFGIRTYDLKEPHMLPSNTPTKWGVKVYQHECDSVSNYISILNNGSKFEDYRKLRKQGINDPFKLVETLGAYASDKEYFPKIKGILRKIRKDYE